MPLRPRTPDELWRELLKRRKITESGCWEYTGKKNRMGYGKIKWMGITTGVHRVALCIKRGVPLVGREIQVCHTCHNRPCFNPDHLYDGTNSTNQLDSVIYGTHHESRKTHCPQGHPYDSVNTISDSGKRKCRICKNIRMRKWWATNGKESRRKRKEKLNGTNDGEHAESQHHGADSKSCAVGRP